MPAPNQGCVSVSGPFYEKLRVSARRHGIPISSFVERVLASILTDVAPSKPRPKARKDRTR